MENNDETFASPTAAAADFEFEALTNGAGDGFTGTGTKSYDATEMDALREAKRVLEEKLDAVSHENGFLSAEAARLEGLVSKAREDIAAAERAAAESEGEAASLRAEVKRLQDLLDAEKAGHDAEKREGPAVDKAELKSAYQEKAALEEEIKALKASVAADAWKEEEDDDETDAPSTVAPKGAPVSPHGMVAAAAGGAAATAAIAVALLSLKR